MNKSLKTIIPLLCILVFSGIFFYKTIFQGLLPIPLDSLAGMYHPWIDSNIDRYPRGMPFKNFLITDPIRQQIPWRKLSIDTIKNGNISGWNPYSFSGAPLSQNIQSGFFYPFNIFFFVLPFPVAWSVLIMSQTILSGLFLFLFLKYSMKLHTFASLFGAMNFMFSGFVMVWLTWGTIVSTLLWLPLLLLFVDLMLVSKTMKKHIALSILTGIILTVQYFAGHTQIFLYSTMLLGFYTVYRMFTLGQSKELSKLWKIPLIVVPIVSLYLTAVHWIPFVSNIQAISRVQNTSGTFLHEGFFFPLQHVVQFLVPDFFGNPATLNYWGIWNYAEFSGYIGIAGFIFVMYALFSKRSVQSVFWFGVVFVGIAFSIDWFVSRIPYTFNIPIFQSLQPTRLISIVELGLSILSAIGLNNWITSGRKRPLILLSGLLLFILGMLWYIVLVNPWMIPTENILVAKRNVILPTILATVLLVVLYVWDRLKLLLLKARMGLLYSVTVLIFGMGLFDLTRFGWKFTPFTDATLFYPQTETISFLASRPIPFRVLSLDDRILPPNVNAMYGIESVSGYDPLYDSRYEKFISAMERGVPNIEPPYGFNRIITPKNISSPLFRLLGVGYVLSLSELSDSRFTLAFQEGETRVYTYLEVLPRAYLLEKILFEKSEQNIIQQLYKPSFMAKSEGVVEENISLEYHPLESGESVSIKAYSDNTVALQVQSNYQRMLYVGNMYHNGWSATIDDQQVPIYRTNYLFMGVLVPNGTHTVLLKYE